MEKKRIITDETGQAIVAQLSRMQEVGNLSDLHTQNKSNVVSAINEVLSDVDSEISRAQAAEATLTTSKQDKISDLAAIRENAMNGSAAYSWGDHSLQGYITKTVNDLTNYYIKSDTYTKTEVNNLISAIKQFTYEVAASLPTASQSTMYKIYLIPSSNPKTQNVKDEFITVLDGSTYKWEQIGSTEIDLSNYPTFVEMTSAINSALANYATKAEVTVKANQTQVDSIDARVDGIEDGTNVPPVAENLKSWKERSSVEVSDEWDAVPVRTTAGSLSINAKEGAHLISVKSQSEFSASGFKASPFNLIVTNQLVSGVPYILVPECTFGTFGTADENNGILVTDSNGNNKKVNMRFKPYAQGAPTSTGDGIECPYRDVQGYRFYIPSGMGYIWASNMSVSDCAHVAWSKDYDKYEQASAFSTISFSTIMNKFTEIDRVYKMLAVNAQVDCADEFVYNGSSFTYSKKCGYDTSSWIDSVVEEGVYLHTKTISGMYANGLARDYANGVELTVEGTTVSYQDGNATSNVAVVYQLATPSTGTVSLANTYVPNDMGCEYIDGISGDAIIITTYLQGLPDELASLPSKFEVNKAETSANINGIISTMTTLGNLRVRNLSSDDIPNVCSSPMIIIGNGAPAELTIPNNWNEETMGEWTGVPMFIGQIYIDISAASNGLYYAKGDSAVTDWKQ